MKPNRENSLPKYPDSLGSFRDEFRLGIQVECRCKELSRELGDRGFNCALVRMHVEEWLLKPGVTDKNGGGAIGVDMNEL